MAQAPTPKPRKPAAPKRPANLPHGRWLGDLGRLSAAEKALVKACGEGRPWHPTDWNGESRPEESTPANTIRGELIRFLVLGGDALNPVHEAGVMAWGAWISGTLDLHQARAAVRLDLRRCHFEVEPTLTAAHLPELALSGSKVPGLGADRLTITGGLFLDEGFTANGEVRLPGAEISGNLTCSGGCFANEGQNALFADGIKVFGDTFLNQGFTATGDVRMLGAEIGGVFDCSGGSITNQGHNALSADRIKVAGSLFLRNGFIANGEVRLLGAEIGGVLDCSGSSFSNESGSAFNADRVKVAGSLFLRNGFIANGEVRLVGAQIGSDTVCSGSRFTNERGSAFNADRIKVAGSIFLHNGFTANGEVRLLGAQIGADVVCIGGRFEKEGGNTLNADGIKLAGCLFLRDSGVKGAVRLAAAHVGSLEDDNACWEVGGHILDGLSYHRIIGPTDAASRIKWLQSQRDDHLTTDFKPQPWEQLIKVLREMGHPYEAGEVAIAKQEQMRAAGVIKGPVRKGMHWLYGKMAGYGHRPIRTVGWMTVVWFLMSVAFWVGADQFAAIGPSNPTITSEALYPDAGKLCGHGNELAKEPGKARWTECPGVPDEYSTFQPFIYSLDLILPLVDLQQDSDWAPIAEGPTGKDLPAGVILRWLMWFEILFGWAASLMLVAVLGRLVEKD